MYQSSLYNTQPNFLYDPRFSQTVPQLYQPHPVQQYSQQQYNQQNYPQYSQQPNQQLLLQQQYYQQQYQQYNQPQQKLQQQQQYNNDQQQYNYNLQLNLQQKPNNQQNDQDYNQQKKQEYHDQRPQLKQFDSAKLAPQVKQPTSQNKLLSPSPGNAVQWMIKPNPILGCPPGLEYLSHIDKLFIVEEPNIIQAITGWQETNKYSIKNSAGQKVYSAFEESGTCMRLCCKQNRGFIIHIVDNMNHECLKITREFKCCVGCCCCIGCCSKCAFQVKVELPNNGRVIGHIEQAASCWKPNFLVIDSDDDEIMQIVGPRCIFDGACCPCDNNFKIISLDGSKTLGSLKKHYGGFANEAWTNAQNFSIDFPIDANIEHKALLIGALFLIDFMYFEAPKTPPNKPITRY